MTALVLILAVICVATAVLCYVVWESWKRQRALDKLEEKRLVGVPERRRIDRHPDVSDRKQVPQQGDGGPS